VLSKNPNSRRKIFFTVNLANRQSDLLVPEKAALQEVIRIVKHTHPFVIGPWSCFPNIFKRSGKILSSMVLSIGYLIGYLQHNIGMCEQVRCRKIGQSILLLKILRSHKKPVSTTNR
jgi:hypothetical protein